MFDCESPSEPSVIIVLSTITLHFFRFYLFLEFVILYFSIKNNPFSESEQLSNFGSIDEEKVYR
jgi:hypothetical protein